MYWNLCDMVDNSILVEVENREDDDLVVFRLSGCARPFLVNDVVRLSGTSQPEAVTYRHWHGLKLVSG